MNVMQYIQTTYLCSYLIHKPTSCLFILDTVSGVRRKLRIRHRFALLMVVNNFFVRFIINNVTIVQRLLAPSKRINVPRASTSNATNVAKKTTCLINVHAAFGLALYAMDASLHVIRAANVVGAG